MVLKELKDPEPRSLLLRYRSRLSAWNASRGGLLKLVCYTLREAASFSWLLLQTLLQVLEEQVWLIIFLSLAECDFSNKSQAEKDEFGISCF